MGSNQQSMDVITDTELEIVRRVNEAVKNGTAFMPVPDLHDLAGRRIVVIEGGRRGPNGEIPSFNGMPISDPPPRYLAEPWIRVCRYTFNEKGDCIKRELATFGMRGGDFVVRWKEFELGATLTDIAPMNQYLVWEE